MSSSVHPQGYVPATMPDVDRSVLWRAALVQALAVAVLSIALALALPHSFFEDWGWLAGPGAWAAVRARDRARASACRRRRRSSARRSPACRASSPSVLGVHWLGAALAIALFALWCARLAREPRRSPARAV